MNNENNLNSHFKQYNLNDGKENIEIIFQDIKKHLEFFIDDSDYIVGCVAWISDSDIIQWLSSRKGASIIVQKDPKFKKLSQEKLRLAANNIPRSLRANMTDLLYYYLSQNNSQVDFLDAVRCVGYIRENNEVIPLMHHKFLVSCDLEAPLPGKDHIIPGQEFKLVPKKFWSGSYNFSANASKSLENVIIGYDADLAEAFYKMWQRIYTISEPLDYNSNHPDSDLKFDMSVFD